MDINEAFETTFKIIFGECNVKLGELEDYLLRWHYPPHFRKSVVSGKEVTVSTNNYCDDAKFISQDEVDFGKKFEPLDIDEIKDIDSIISAWRDRFYYAGNNIFGTSKYIQQSDNCTDSFYVYNSHNVTSSRYIAYSSYIRDGSEFAFGGSWFVNCKYTIKTSVAGNLTRCFETYISANSADLFFCYNCLGCLHTMFSFNQRSRRYCIGNVELPKDRYFELRKKLVDESREYLERNKTFYSIFDIAPISPKLIDWIKDKRIKTENEKEYLEPIQHAFDATAKAIFGKEIGSFKNYEAYLSERIERIKKTKTVFGNELYYSDYAFYKNVPKERMVKSDELGHVKELKIDIAEEDSLGSILKKIPDIALYQMDFREGTNSNTMKTPVVYHAINSYYVGDITNGKNCAYCTMALHSEAIFGSFRLIYSKFCIRCENSVNLTACFEMDACSNCSNSMFCHNCENLDHCMFCFNTKSKRYAVGNVEIGREQYMKIRQIVISEILKKLERNGKLGFDIYTVGCK